MNKQEILEFMRSYDPTSYNQFHRTIERLYELGEIPEAVYQTLMDDDLYDTGGRRRGAYILLQTLIKKDIFKSNNMFKDN